MPSNQLSKCIDVAIDIETIMAGKVIEFVVHIRAVAKMSSNNCGVFYRQALAIKQINDHLSKQCLVL